MVSILANTLRDSHKLTAVYLMDDGEFDRLLPLEVVPEPRAITRVGMVIVRNSDPSAGSDVDDLIAQLADPAWSRRNEAYQALAKVERKTLNCKMSLTSCISLSNFNSLQPIISYYSAPNGIIEIKDKNLSAFPANCSDGSRDVISI